MTPPKKFDFYCGIKLTGGIKLDYAEIDRMRSQYPLSSCMQLAKLTKIHQRSLQRVLDLLNESKETLTAQFQAVGWTSQQVFFYCIFNF